VWLRRWGLEGWWEGRLPLALSSLLDEVHPQRRRGEEAMGCGRRGRRRRRVGGGGGWGGREKRGHGGFGSGLTSPAPAHLVVRAAFPRHAGGGRRRGQGRGKRRVRGEESEEEESEEEEGRRGG